ncbi:MAG: hypothetical protein LBD20_03435 [Spirochaetaceae bacterium]|jgi:hypothetical protein|nr:hypothetical protein [Spirochaetaceae bacterium]
MHIFKSIPFTIRLGTLITLIISLFCTFLTFYKLPRTEQTAASFSSDAFVVAVFNDDVDAQELTNALTQNNINNVLAESTQTVFLNNFSSIEKLTPSQFLDHIMDIDPRNDGFAKELYNFFISNNENRFYIPVSSFGSFINRSSNVDTIKNRIVTATGSSLRNIYFLGTPQQAKDVLSSIAFIAAWILTMYLSVRHLWLRRPPAKRAYDNRQISHNTPPNNKKDIPKLFPLIILLPCAFLGVSGCILTAAMLAIRQSITRHISNLIIKLYLRRTINTSIETIFQSVLLAVVYIIISFFTAGITFAVLLFILFFFADTTAGFFTNIGFNGRRAHLRFAELPIRFRDDSKRHIPFSTIIFLFFSCAAAAISFFAAKMSPMSVYEPAIIKKNQTQFEKINAQSWQRHYEFQKNFSFTKIKAFTDMQTEESGLENNTTSAGKTGVESGDDAQYLHYTIAENGLISGAQPIPEISEQEPLPPYPLATLIETIENPQRQHIQSSSWRNIVTPVLSCLLLSIAFTTFSLLIRRKKSAFCL